MRKASFVPTSTHIPGGGTGPSAAGYTPAPAGLLFQTPPPPPRPPHPTVNPPPAPPAEAPAPREKSPARPSQLYRWTDEQDVVHWTDRWDAVPQRYRVQAKQTQPS